MNTWNQDKYIKAWHYASNAHTGQVVPGTDIPYINHIGLVAMEAMATTFHEKVEDPDLLVLSALLHDTIEDTKITVEDITQTFGKNIAHGVLALTKNDSLPSKAEKMSDSLERIRKQPKEIWMVKLSDRITNLQPPPAHWSRQKAENYLREAEEILHALELSSPYLSSRMRDKIKAYEKFI